MLMAAARSSRHRDRGPAIAALAIVTIGVLHQVFGMLFGAVRDRRARERRSEPWQATHTVVAVELVLLFAAGIFFMTTPGFEWAASVARVFTVQP